MLLERYKIGSDPEYFVSDILGQENQVVPAFKVLETVESFKIAHGEVYCDGAALECTLNPSNDPEVLSHRLFENIRDIRSIVREKSKTNPRIGDLYLSSFGYIPIPEILSLPEELGPKASLCILGCQPDARVYVDAPPIERPDPKKFPYRSIGGHIHFELPKSLLENSLYIETLVMACDAIFGTYGTYACSDEMSFKRKTLYGKSGTFRIKDGGKTMEYRCLPSKAISSSKTIAYHVFSLATKLRAACAELYPNTLQVLGGIGLLKMVSDAIDQHNTDVCRDLQRFVSDNIERATNIDLWSHVGQLLNIDLIPDSIGELA